VFSYDDGSFEPKHVAKFLILITIYIVVLLTGINYYTNIEIVKVTCLNNNTKWMLQAQQTLHCLKAITTAHNRHLATRYSSYSTVCSDYFESLYINKKTKI